MKATANNNEVINTIDEEMIENINYIANYEVEDITAGAVRKLRKKTTKVVFIYYSQCMGGEWRKVELVVINKKSDYKFVEKWLKFYNERGFAYSEEDKIVWWD